MEGELACLVCVREIDAKERVQLKCGHLFCRQCIIKFIQTMRMYNQLRPDKLCCLSEGCHEEIEDAIITKLFPGQLGFIFNIIKKRYRESKDQNMVIFDCKGYITADRKPLVQRPSSISQQDHAMKLNELSRKITKGEETVQGAKTCKNIFAHNKKIPRKQKNIVCLTCGCSYCVNCFELGHEGACPIKDEETVKNKLISDKLDKKGDDFQNFVTRNQILTCLNPKCQAVIAKEQGCFWVKCRCSYEMCYPCKKLWGDCQHFSKYPYSKFTPPPDWMVKALGLF